ncbi:MAG: aminotransferase class V-fold PLP-dependent enzyme [Steroidobacteraceae bacterium]
MSLAAHWGLDPSVVYLNHGSYGACPSPVLAAQSALRLEMERELVDFMNGALPARLKAARQPLGSFVGADPADLVFVTNATMGVNAVLRSLPFGPDDELLVTSHTYNACRMTVNYVAARSGVRIVVADLPFPCRHDDDIVAAILERVSPRTRLALIDHVTSPTALVLPLARLVRELESRGVDTLVDGAHAPGMVRVALDELGAAYYTGNAHKWMCAPKGAAFLHVRRNRQAALHPTVISHGYDSGFQTEFDWTGTCDPTAWLCIPEAIRFMGGLLPGGWPEVMTSNRALVLRARRMLFESLRVEAPCPESMIGTMATIPLPKFAAGSLGAGLDADGLHDWFRRRGVELWFHPQPFPICRISAQLYNDFGQFERLAAMFRELS